VLMIPLPGGLGVFWTGKHDVEPFADPQLSGFQRVAAAIAARLQAPEALDVRLDRLARIDAVDEVLPVVAGALDVREMFHRLSDVAKTVLPHDVAMIQIISDDHTRARLYALDGIPREHVPDEVPTNWAPLFSE